MHGQSFKPQPEPAVRRRAVLVQHQVGFELLGVHAKALHLFHLHVVVVYPLSAARDLYSSEQQVERKGDFGVFGVVHSVEGAFFRKVVRYKQEVAAVLLLCPLAQKCLLLGLEVLHVGYVLQLLYAQLLSVLKADAWDLVYLRYIGFKQFDFGRILRFKQLHDVFQHARLHLHYVGKAVYKTHLEVHGDIFVEVPARVVVLGAEHGAYLEHALVNGHQRLLVKLRTLRKEHRLTEVIELEHVCAALGAGKVYLGGVYFRESVLGKVFAEAALYAFLYLEYGAFRRVAQRNGAEVEVCVQVAVDFFLGDDHGRDGCGNGEYLYVVYLQFKAFAAVARLALHHLARNLCRSLFNNVLRKAVVGKLRRIYALDKFARRAQDNKGKVAHVPYVVNRALHRNHFPFVLFELAVGGSAVCKRACHVFHSLPRKKIYVSILRLFAAKSKQNQRCARHNM